MHIGKCRLANGQVVVGKIENNQFFPFEASQNDARLLTTILESEDVSQAAAEVAQNLLPAVGFSELQWLAPMDQQEVWAAGVTYTRSKTARMEESEAAASCYDRVYVSDRPEIFMKATPHRVAGHEGALRIRGDATWNVPEPEFTLVLNSRLEYVAATIGNDMSSRDIEGDNPLYLPQAKVYDQCAGLGPWLTLRDSLPERSSTSIHLSIRRYENEVFTGTTDLSQMARGFEELIHWLGRDHSFPDGVFLMTGTGIVPDNNFTLHDGDVVDISIDGIGTLSNSIIQTKQSYVVPKEEKK